MNADIIGYRLTRAEWATLSMLLELSDPFEVLEMTLDEQGCRDAYDSLCALGILSPVGDRVVVDRLFDYMLNELSQSTLSLEVRAPERQFELCVTPRIVILAERTLTHAVLTPLPSLTEARDFARAALRHCATPVVVELQDIGSTLRSMEAPDRPKAQAVLDEMFNAFVAESIK